MIIYDILVLPILFILRLTVIPLVPKARARVKYEKASRNYIGAKSFSEDGIKADIAFEFSSEGELQQCLPLVEMALKENQKIELIYFSPSVEKGVHQLYEKHPTQIRVMNFPLLSYLPTRNASLRRWITAPKLVLVRYDFFPEIILWAKGRGHSLQLIWASFKKKRERKKMLSFYQQLFLESSQKVVAATQADADYILTQRLNVTSVFDFRIIQISLRLKDREQTLQNKFPGWCAFYKLLNFTPEKKRVIFGNAWPKDLELISEDYLESVRSKEKLWVIVPHVVSKESADYWKKLLSDRQIAVHEIFPDSNMTDIIRDYQENPGVVILHIKGVLCELYHYFAYAYVGGGLGVSVHSLLEPFVSGSQFIACGPNVSRSTEFDLANQDARVVSIINTPYLFDCWFSLEERDKLEMRYKKLDEYQSRFSNLRKNLGHAKESL